MLSLSKSECVDALDAFIDSRVSYLPSEKLFVVGIA
jgi:hypothetical protein